MDNNGERVNREEAKSTPNPGDLAYSSSSPRGQEGHVLGYSHRSGNMKRPRASTNPCFDFVGDFACAYKRSRQSDLGVPASNCKFIASFGSQLLCRHSLQMCSLLSTPEAILSYDMRIPNDKRSGVDWFAFAAVLNSRCPNLAQLRMDSGRTVRIDHASYPSLSSQGKSLQI